MTATLARLAALLQQLFFADADRAADRAALIRRRRQLTACAFAQGLVFAWLQKPQATTNELRGFVACAGSDLSEPALCQRFTPAAAAFFLDLLQRALRHCLAADAEALPLLGRFHGVHLTDSTQLNLPAELADLWPASGGNATPAGVKCMLSWEILSGQLKLQLGPGRQSDQQFDAHRQALPKGALRLADLGFFDLDALAEYAAAGVYFISRVQPHTQVELAGQCQPLWRRLRDCGEDRLDEWVEVGQKQRLRCRLVAWRCPARVAEQRRRKARQSARRHQRPLSEQQLVMCDWTVLITNVPEEMLSGDEVWVVYRVRWQVELLVRRWKSQAGLRSSRGKKVYRVLVEVYAKLLGCVLTSWLELLGGGWWLGRSLWKSGAEVQGWGKVLLVSLGSWGRLVEVLGLLGEVLGGVAGVDARRQRPATWQTLVEPQANGPRVGHQQGADAPGLGCFA